MPDPVMALIITYERTELAVKTIRSVKEKVKYPNIGFHIADDGSRLEHILRLREEIGPTYYTTITDAGRGGVGKSMNLGMKACLDKTDFILWLEDDWVLPDELDLEPCVKMLQERTDIGMVRLGRLTAGLQGETFSSAGKLWWKLHRNQTYVFSGNAALRHRRFCDAYGLYKEGLRPGETELAMCGQFMATSGPEIAWPAWVTPEKAFQHIGDHQSFKYYMESEGMTAEQAVRRFRNA